MQCARCYVRVAACPLLRALCCATLLALLPPHAACLLRLLLTPRAGEVPAALTAGVASDAVGRRATVGTGLLLTGLFCGLCTLPAGWWSTLLALVAKGACSGCWTITCVLQGWAAASCYLLGGLPVLPLSASGWR